MRSHVKVRSRAILAMAAVSVPVLAGGFASGQIYSTTANPIYTPGGLKIGANSASSISNLLELDNGVIAGSLSSGPLYYLPTQSPYTPSLISTDANHSGNPSLVAVSSAGVLIGTQNRVSGSTPLGTDVFIYNGSGSQVYLPIPTTVLGGGAAYSYTNQSVSMASYTMNANQPTDSSLSPATYAVGPTGVIAGTVQRYSGDANNANVSRNTIVGTDAFYYNPTTQLTTAVGLTGGAYNYYNSGAGTVYQNNVVTGVAGTSVAGYAYRYLSSGTSSTQTGFDSWIYNPSYGSSAIQIGLVGGAYAVTIGSDTYESSQTFRTNSLGQVAGKSVLPNSSNGATTSVTNYAWLYTPSSTPGTATAFGNSSAGTYTQLGLVGAPSGTTIGYSNPTSTTFQANNNVNFLSNQGHAAGTTNRYDVNGNFEGAAAWVYNGTTNIDISPVDSVTHLAVAGGTNYSSNSLTAMNNTGLFAGNVTRVAGTSGSASLGQDAYVYDSTTGHEYFVDPTDEAKGINNYEFSYVGTLGDNGDAVGFFGVYTGATASTLTGYDLFVWSENSGNPELEVLGTLPSSASTSTLSSYVASFEFGSDGTLYGPSTYGTTAPGIVAYSAVPEPSTLSLVAIGALGLLRRRRARVI